nr:DUF1624 domain-containing protein [uncultured Pseudomonas sp.]
MLMMPSSTPSALSYQRLHGIDALRGFVMLIMLLDHVRETFFMQHQVSDPMAVESTEPALFVSRTLAHLCAPVFVLLTGLSAWLYGEKRQSRVEVSAFLFKRGLFLVVLEFTLVNFAWTFQAPPTVIYLQVIWAIGISMIALSALIWMPRAALLAVGLVLIAGHNLLDGLHVDAASPWHVPWAIAHDRSWLDITPTLRMRTSYPVLPWIGVIAVGYWLGPWFCSACLPAVRQRRLLLVGGGALLGFVVLRLINGYGEAPWSAYPTLTQTSMSFFNITKYPPSLAFLTLTLGTGLLVLRAFERVGRPRWITVLAVFGAAPMFFYLVHLYVLKLLYLGAVAVWGHNQGAYFGFESITGVWLTSALLPLMLYPSVHWFARLKARRRDLAWLKYL